MPAVDLLRQLPGVVDVEVLVAAPKANRRIIHLRDWHHVPRDRFALDVGKPLTDADYAEHLLQVELVQVEQAAVLECLVRHHGLRRVLVEGLTPKGVAAFEEVVASLREEGGDLADLEKQQGKSAAIDREVQGLLQEHRRRLVVYGSVARLAGGKFEPLPLDDDALLDAADPVTPDGKVRIDPAKVEARHDGQVKRALASGPCSLLILGGAHDLSASVQRHGGGTTEYVRVTTRRLRQVSGAGPSSLNP